MFLYKSTLEYIISDTKKIIGASCNTEISVSNDTIFNMSGWEIRGWIYWFHGKLGGRNPFYTRDQILSRFVELDGQSEDL